MGRNPARVIQDGDSRTPGAGTDAARKFSGEHRTLRHLLKQ